MPTLPIASILDYWKHIQPDAIAIAHENNTTTWAELDARSNRLARAYAQLGVGQDNIVTIALPNGIPFFEACFACWKLGATPQPISSKLPKLERDKIIEVANPVLIVGVADNEYTSVKTLPKNFEADSSLSDEAQEDVRIATYSKAMTSGGSTGQPKLIVANTPAVCDPDAEVLLYQKQGSVLVPGPLYHNGPFVWAVAALFKGNRVTIVTRFDAEETLNIIETQKVDTLYTVPTMMQRIWMLPQATREQYDLSSLNVLWHSAAPCPAWLKEAFINWLGAERIWEVYGGTESIGTTVIQGTEWLSHKGSVGKPIPTCEMKVVGDNGEELEAGQTGEIYMRPYPYDQSTTYHYIGAQSKLLKDGWESLGDIGYFDQDGYLYIADRLTDMIISGGANIYPAEVEAAIDACPGVRSCAVIGLPYKDMGNAVHAIVDAPEGNLNEDILLDHLSQRLAKYKLPRSFEFVTQTLRNDAGKVRRKQLREERLEKLSG